MIFSVELLGKAEVSKGLFDLEFKKRTVRSQVIICKQNNHCDANEPFETFTKIVTNTSAELLEESKAATKATEDNNKNHLELLMLQLIQKKS